MADVASTELDSQPASQPASNESIQHSGLLPRCGCGTKKKEEKSVHASAVTTPNSSGEASAELQIFAGAGRYGVYLEYVRV